MELHGKTLDQFTMAYIECMLWSSTEAPFGDCPDCGECDQILCRMNDDGDYVCTDCSEKELNNPPPMDDSYNSDDISPECLNQIIEDCTAFQESCADDLKDYPIENAGHDFWLTREHHGAGFWENDFGTKESCKRLTECAHAYGDFYLHVGDDGKLHC